MQERVEETSTLSCICFRSEFFEQGGIFSHEFYQGFRNRILNRIALLAGNQVQECEEADQAPATG